MDQLETTDGLPTDERGIAGRRLSRKAEHLAQRHCCTDGGADALVHRRLRWVRFPEDVVKHREAQQYGRQADQQFR